MKIRKFINQLRFYGAAESEMQISDKGKNMAKKVRKKRHRRLSLRMFKVITWMVFIATLLGIVNSTVHSTYILFRDWIVQGETVAQSAAGAIDHEKAKQLSDAILSKQAESLRADAASDEAYADALRAYLDSEGLTESMNRLTSLLTRVEQTALTDEAMLFSCNENSCRCVAASEEKQSALGSTKVMKVAPVSAGSDINYAITDEEDGTPKIYSFVPLEEGTAEYEMLYVGCARNVRPLLKEAGGYILNMGSYLLAVTAICALLGFLLTRQMFAAPILKVKKAAEEFRASNSVDQSAKPIRPNVKTRDEIEDLSDSLYDLETSVVETQEKLREEYIEKGRISEQLSIASGIQNGVLPTDFPKNTQYELYALMHPARQVGGDFYDFFLTDDKEHLVMVIGDVSDKGIPAALFMMAGKTTVRSVVMNERDPAKVLVQVNNTLYEQNPMSMFITIWIGILNLNTGVMNTASAGHEYPFMALEGRPFEQINDIHGLVVGELPNMKYKTCTYQLHKGDRVFVYTDGATDAMNTAEEQIGTKQLLEIVQSEAHNETAKDLSLAVKERIDTFSEGMAQFDDITILSLTWFGPSKPAEAPSGSMHETAELKGDLLQL
ncbi:MAG: PP2C family protein-serine/threonine phosphatase [Solobacterium sp.]|nr:PP2C family protein-serine/threonine phosphatase [Solobacterium sp.]